MRGVPVSGPLAGVRVLKRDEIEVEQWRAFLSASSQGTFFHTPDWMDLLIHSFPAWEGFVAIAEDEAGRWLAILPAIRVARLGMHGIHSMPFGTFGGPIAPDAIAHDAIPIDPITTDAIASDAVVSLCDALLSIGHSPASRGVVLTTYRNPSIARREGVLGDRFTRGRVRTQILELAGGYPEVWLEHCDHQRRRQARCGERRGVAVRRGSSIDDFRACCAIYEEGSRDWDRRQRVGLPFFERLSEMDPEHVRLWVAEVDGRIVAGNVSFIYGDLAISWIGTMLRTYRSYHPAVALHRASIRDACDVGCREYHFGPSPGLESVARFKGQFGAQWGQYDTWAALSPLGRLIARIRPKSRRRLPPRGVRGA
jgi:hypothetical protein